MCNRDCSESVLVLFSFSLFFFFFRLFLRTARGFYARILDNHESGNLQSEFASGFFERLCVYFGTKWLLKFETLAFLIQARW